MKKLWILMLPILLSGCIEEIKVVNQNQALSQCFEAFPAQQNMMPLILDKCTGKTWLLSKVTLHNERGKSTGTFTYRWNSLSVDDGEAELSYPGFK